MERELTDEALPDLTYVIRWLENGCDPLAAAKELRLYQDRMSQAPQPAQGPIERNSVGETPTEHAHRWATELATSMAKKFYPEVTQWLPLHDLLGVITQIDNMTTGLVRAQPSQVKEPPVSLTSGEGEVRPAEAGWRYPFRFVAKDKDQLWLEFDGGTICLNNIAEDRRGPIVRRAMLDAISAALAQPPARQEPRQPHKDGKYVRAWLQLDALPGGMMQASDVGLYGPVPGSCSAWLTTSETEVSRWHAKGEPALEVWVAQPQQPNIKTMVDRFLGWKLPLDFCPDCYISFYSVDAQQNGQWPIGTNLLTADQAKAMFEYCMAMPQQGATK